MKPEDFLSVRSQAYLYPTYIDSSVLSHFKMYTASTVTTLVVLYLALGNVPDIANCICILAATKGDGTLLHSDSFHEEDIVKLCIGLDQVYPEGVLWLLDTEMVLAFRSSFEMLATMHPLTVAMV